MPAHRQVNSKFSPKKAFTFPAFTRQNQPAAFGKNPSGNNLLFLGIFLPQKNAGRYNPPRRLFFHQAVESINPMISDVLVKINFLFTGRPGQGDNMGFDTVVLRNDRVS